MQISKFTMAIAILSVTAFSFGIVSDVRAEKGDAKPGSGQKGKRPSFDDIDKNNDGSISKIEAPARMKQHFDKIDENGDGNITKGELKSARDRMGKGKKGDGKPGAGKGKQGDGKPGDGKPGAGKGKGGKGRFDEIDENNDGSISKAEAPAKMKQHFDKIDTNGDGQVTPGELKAAREKMGQRKGKGKGGAGKGGPGKAGKGKRPASS